MPGTSSSLAYPTGSLVDSVNGDFYLSTLTNNRIRVLSGSTSTFSTIAGSGVLSTLSTSDNGDGGAATSCTFNGPDGLFLDSVTKALYVVDRSNNKIRQVYSIDPTVAPTFSRAPSCQPSRFPTTLRPSTIRPSVRPTAPTLIPTPSPSLIPTTYPASRYIVTVAGGSQDYAATNANIKATASCLHYPKDVTVDTSGNVYIVIRDLSCIRRFSPADNIMLDFAGVCGDASSNFVNSVAATSTTLLSATAMAFDTLGTLYFSDQDGCRVRKVVSGVMTAVAGNGNSGDTDGVATTSLITSPLGVYADTVGVVYIVLQFSNRVKKVDLSGMISAFAGAISYGGYEGDGGSATSATFSSPERIIGDTSGNVYISDTGLFEFCV